MTTIGVWGCFDSESLGAQLALRISTAELERRLPGVRIRAFAPCGATRPIAFDGGEPVEPLSPPTPSHVDALAGALDLVVLTGNLSVAGSGTLAATYGITLSEATPLAHLLLSGLPDVPRAWSCVSVPPDVASRADGCVHVSVVDEASLSRLPAATLVPEPALLAPRIFPPRALEKRLAFLQAMGWWPEVGAPILLQGSTTDVEQAAAVATALGDRQVVLIGADAGDSEFALVMAALLPHALRIPELAGVEDRVAAVTAAGAVVTSSATFRALAMAYGRPYGDTSAPSSLHDPEPSAGPADSLDAEYDALACLLPEVEPAPLVTAEVAALHAALDARGRRLAIERAQMADYVWSLKAEHEGALAQCAAVNDALARENALLRSRWSIRLRSAAGRTVRRLRRRR